MFHVSRPFFVGFLGWLTCPRTQLPCAIIPYGSKGLSHLALCFVVIVVRIRSINHQGSALYVSNLST